MTEVMDVPTNTPITPAATPAPGSEPTGWMGETGEFRDGAPETIQGLLESKKWTNVEQLADAYVELEKFKGSGEHLRIPEKEDDAGWQDVYNLMGRPATHGEYKFTEDPDVPFGEEILDRFRQGAHEKGFSQSQAAWVLDLQRDIIKEAAVAETEHVSAREQENVQAMKRKWGEANYETTFKGLEATAQKLQVLDYFRQLGIDKEPEIVNMLITLTNSDAEDSLTPPSAMEVAKTAIQERAEIMKSEPYLKRFHPEHKATMIRYMELNQDIANAGQGSAPRT